MPTLEHDSLVFRFPAIEEDAAFSIDFQRTLRIPDTDKTYPLPPGLGAFPLKHVSDHAHRLPEHTVTRGGVFLPIWQAEAMWLNFHNKGPDWGLPFPVAIKIAAGRINAITGETWREGLNRDPQDYVVSPEQPWLDGFAIEKGIIRQFVAMPLGEGDTAEEQLTGGGEWGGLQISVIPLKAQTWLAKRSDWEKNRQEMQDVDIQFMMSSAASPDEMGLAPGGRMEQTIYPDGFDLDDWDVACADQVFVTLVHAKDWMSITGEPAPNQPPSAREYSGAGLPWFDYYGKDQTSVSTSSTLADLKSVAVTFKDKTGSDLPESQDVETGTPTKLGLGAN